ncbi:MAG: hypothetical protein IJB96_03535 [Lachnospira sp.]|nr:hypothetical protein [Lachnospira sp.]
MNDDFIAEISVKTGTDNIISVSGNDVEVPVETSPPDETETETAGEENIVSVSGNDSNSDTGSDDGSFSESVFGNSVYVPYDDSGLVAQVGALSSDISELNTSIQGLHATVIGIYVLLTMLLGFTLFKWCEQKIKRFMKGVFNKYE